MRAFYLFVFAAMLVIAAGCGAEADGKKLTVHEWGTFTSIADSNGVPLPFYANNDDLPKFIYRRGSKFHRPATVSLETPVTYFYAQEPMLVKAAAQFPKGQFTEWYPAATSEHKDATGRIFWSDIEVLPGQTAELPGTGEKGHYFRARDADANLLRIKVRNQYEHENFLFYRGIGDPVLPLRVAAKAVGDFVLTNQGADSIPAWFLVTVKDKQATFVPGSEIKPGASITVSFHKTATGTNELVNALSKALVAQGLYEKEATAMVATWRDAWLEESGTRVLYLLDTKASDRLLPLEITPEPTTIVRVMVGRQDVFTPAQEEEFKYLQAAFIEAQARANEAFEKFNRFGRFSATARERAKQLLQSQTGK